MPSPTLPSPLLQPPTAGPAGVRLRGVAASLAVRTALALAGAFAVLTVATWVTLRLEYRVKVGLILADSQRTALKLAARTAEVFDAVSQTTLLVKTLHERASLPPLPLLRDSGLLANDVTRGVLLADAKGHVVNASSADFPLNIGDEDDFKRHKARADLDVILGTAAVDPLGGGHMLPVSRRVNTDGGAFDGIVTALVDPVALTAGYALGEAHDTVLGVVGADGVYRSRILDGRSTFGERIDLRELLDSERRIRATGQPITSPIDGVARFVTVASVDKYPMYAMVALNAETALSEYRRARRRILSWASMLALVSTAAIAALALQARQLEAGRARTRRAEAVFRATLEGSLDAVTILRAERDAGGQLVDMTIVDSNSRAAALFDRTREQVIGRRLCELASSVASDGHLMVFEQVMTRQRPADGEIETAQPGSAKRWLHHQVVPIEDGVALITRDITDRKVAEAQLAAMARMDALTHLPNRRHFDERLPEALARRSRNPGALALLFIDLDGFKQVNDTLGHAVGDRLLVSVAGRLRGSVRGTDIVSRLGGDEFTVIMENAGTEQQVRDLCQRILQALSQPHHFDGERVVATPSIGAAIASIGESAASLIERADGAMYAAKRAGKARFHLLVAGEKPSEAPPHSRPASLPDAARPAVEAPSDLV